MTAENDILLSGLILALAAVVAVPLFKRLGLGSVLGYLTAGFLVGPSVLGVTENVEALRHFAEFGVVFLLFIIGLELHPSRLWAMRTAVFGMGTAQIILSTVAIALYATWLGIGINTAIVLGLALSLSSTAIVMQHLKEKGEIASPHGQSAFAILLMQDIAVVPLIALVPIFGEAQAYARMSFTDALLPLEAVVVVLLATRYVTRPILPLIARFGTSEVFTGFVLLTVLGAALLMHEVGMSMALGAFLVGLVLSGSRYVHQIEAEIEPFRGLLLGLFFMAVGMSINTDIIANETRHLIQHTLVILLLKGLVIYSVMLLFGHGRKLAFRVSMLLPQSGEFGFVLFGIAFAAGVPSRTGFQMAMAVIALSMAITPLLIALSERIAARSTRDSDKPEAPEDQEDHVVIIGFGRMGETVAIILQDAGVPFITMDNDPLRVDYGKSHDYPAFYGDCSNPQVLRAVCAHTPRMVIVTLNKPQLLEQTLHALRELNPELKIVTRAYDFEQSKKLRESGAYQVVPETVEAGLQLSEVALSDAGMQDNVVEEILSDYRLDDYRRLRNALSKTS